MATLTNKVTEQILGVSRTTIDKYVKDGKLTVVSTSRPRKFESKEVYKLFHELGNQKYKHVVSRRNK